MSWCIVWSASASMKVSEETKETESSIIKTNFTSYTSFYLKVILCIVQSSEAVMIRSSWWMQIAVTLWETGVLRFEHRFWFHNPTPINLKFLQKKYKTQWKQKINVSQPIPRGWSGVKPYMSLKMPYTTMHISKSREESIESYISKIQRRNNIYIHYIQIKTPKIKEKKKYSNNIYVSNIYEFSYNFFCVDPLVIHFVHSGYVYFLN